jgi:signal transduction histidine kinase
VNLTGGVAVAIPGLMLASAASYLLDQFKAERELLITAKLVTKHKQISQEEQQKLSHLASALRALSKRLEVNPDHKLPLMELGLIKRLVDAEVRPLASEIFKKLESSHQSFALSQLFKAAIKTRPRALALTLPLVSVIPRTIDWFGPVFGVVGVVGVMVALYFALRVGGWVFELAGFQNAVSYYVVTILAPLVTIFAAIVAFDILESRRMETAIFVVVSALLFSTVVGMAEVALRSADQNRSEVRNLENESVGSELALLSKRRRELANQIHGEVQSRLMNLVLQNEAGDRVGRQLVIAELQAIADLIDDGPNLDLSFEQSIAKLVATWDGFVQITVDESVQAMSRSQPDKNFALIEEAVTNAFKHGLATEVFVTLSGTNELVITDNGLGPKGGRPGLGSKILTSLGRGWSLRPGDSGGSVLRIELPRE